jgi:dihydroanticapsin dehydrogenase
LARLQGKVSIVTGAGSGIGEATAILFAHEGAKVVVVDIDNTSGNRTASKIQEARGEAVFFHADVTKEADMERVVNETLSKWGKLDVMYNNAGIIQVKRLIDSTVSEWDRLMDVNLKGLFLGSKYAAKHMIGTKSGSIINTASIYGITGAPYYVPYCTTKGGAIAFTKSLALELAPYNVRVNCICPGVISTPMFEGELAAWNKIQPGDNISAFKAQHPIGRFGEPLDIANAALYLASDESSFVTGSALVVDGGYTAI